MSLRKNIFAILSGTAVTLLAACGGNAPTPAADTEEATNPLVVTMPLADSVRAAYDTINIGRIPEGDVISGSFTLTNSSDRPLVILEVITGCGCTTADYDASPLAPGAKRLIKYRFDSRGRYGEQFKSIEIISSDRQCATVYLSGEVI